MPGLISRSVGSSGIGSIGTASLGSSPHTTFVSRVVSLAVPVVVIAIAALRAVRQVYIRWYRVASDAPSIASCIESPELIYPSVAPAAGINAASMIIVAMTRGSMFTPYTYC